MPVKPRKPNDLCHCGSGKKYKRCCMKQEESSHNSPIFYVLGNRFNPKVFMTTDLEEIGGENVALGFSSQIFAQKYLNRLKAKKPDMAKDATIRELSWDEVFTYCEAARKDQDLRGIMMDSRYLLSLEGSIPDYGVCFLYMLEGDNVYGTIRTDANPHDESAFAALVFSNQVALYLYMMHHHDVTLDSFTPSFITKTSIVTLCKYSPIIGSGTLIINRNPFSGKAVFVDQKPSARLN